MEKELIISVIIPVYNGEAFVRRAVDSVLGQMDGRIELILVNDGSTDASGAICDEYAQKYPDIHVIHKPNGGTSSAKNMGINVAKGTYLTFFDCDDFIDDGAFSQIIPVLQEYRPDCLDFGWRYVNCSNETFEAFHQCRKNVLIPLQELEDVILPPLLNLRKDDAHFIFDFCWNKLFRAEIIHHYHVRFDEEKKTFEDRTFILRHLKYCQNYYAMDRCFYNYVYTPNSLSQRYCPDCFKIVLANFAHYRELFGDRFDFDSQYANDYWVQAVEKMIFVSLDQKENRSVIYENILETLKHEQVLHWFTKCQPKDAFGKKVQGQIMAGEYGKAIGEYSKKSAQRRRKQAVCSIKLRIRHTLGKLLGR